MSASAVSRQQIRCRIRTTRRWSAPEIETTNLEHLESFMRNVCQLLESHPEWRQQSAEERLPSILQALRQL